MPVNSGTVSSWNDEEGWGVVASPATPGGCWVHVSSVSAGGRPLAVGEAVSFAFEPANQDGYRFRAVEVWPAGQEPDRSHRRSVEGPSGGYSSSLTLEFDTPKRRED